jgi:REP element-mobilizing transposase RayT
MPAESKRGAGWYPALPRFSGIPSRSTKTMNKSEFREFYRRRLPHIQEAGSTYFVTFRLKNSLPREALEKLKLEAERSKESSKARTHTEQNLWFEKFDDYLDKALCGENYLANPQIANVVIEAIHYRNMKVYDLISFCIMPNHVHLVFAPLEREKGDFYNLHEILHSLKRHTARQSNLILNRTGSFWQDESYDHILRDEAELERTLKYILYNPVKANLVKEQQDWKWSYCKYEL